MTQGSIKGTILEFIRRGLVAASFGPLVLVILYLILQQHYDLQTLTVDEVCLGILSLSALAFMAGGMNVIYQIERLPLMVAILIHGSVLYLCYLATYLLNGWLERSTAPVLVFTVIFVLVYLAVWAVIYSITKRKTDELNVLLQKKQNTLES